MSDEKELSDGEEIMDNEDPYDNGNNSFPKSSSRPQTLAPPRPSPSLNPLLFSRQEDSIHHLPVHLQSTHITKYWRNLIRKIVEIGKKIETPINIAIYGYLGAGKSSVINTINTIFSTSSEPLHSQFTMGVDEHVTLTLSTVRLPGTKICLLDTFGLSSTPAPDADRFFESVLDGRIGEGYVRLAPLEDHILPQHMRKDKAVSAVIFLQEAVSVQAFQAPATRQHVALLKLCTDRGLVPTILLTKLDESVDPLTFDPRKMYSYSQVPQLLGLTSRMLGVESCHVYPIKSYTVETHRDKYLEVAVLAGLYNAVKSARRFQARQLRGERRVQGHNQRLHAVDDEAQEEEEAGDSPDSPRLPNPEELEEDEMF